MGINHRSSSLDVPSLPGAAGHDVQFYASELFLEQAVCAYLGEGLRRGEGAVIIATQEHGAAFRRRLEADGAPIEEAMRAGRVMFLDAAQTLSWILAAGGPSSRAFHNTISACFDMIADRAPRTPVRAYGEMVDLLWNEGRLCDALALERLWNAFLRRRPAPLLCAYRLKGVIEHPDAIDAVCAVHAGAAFPARCARGRDDLTG